MAAKLKCYFMKLSPGMNPVSSFKKKALMWDATANETRIKMTPVGKEKEKAGRKRIFLPLGKTAVDKCGSTFLY